MEADGAPGIALVVVPGVAFAVALAVALLRALVKGDELANAETLLDAESLVSAAGTLFLVAGLLFTVELPGPDATAFPDKVFCDSLLLLATGREGGASGFSGRPAFAAEVGFAGAASCWCEALFNTDASGVFSPLSPLSPLSLLRAICVAFSLSRVELGEAGELEAARFDFSGSSVRGEGPALAAT